MPALLALRGPMPTIDAAQLLEAVEGMR